ncbi:MAG TPA: hypothetical protein VLU24_00470 [Mycobacterium sp.]|nr:hypothetical protein [Mycobacterium sp.]
MLATFGLQRVESHLNRGCVGAADVAEFLAQARPGDLRTLALDGMPEALDSFQRWHTRSIDQSRQLTHLARTMANPQFRPTRQRDSV